MIKNPKKLIPEDCPTVFESIANMPQELKDKVDERMKEAHRISESNKLIARFMGWKDVLHQTLSPNAESGFKNEYYRLDSPDGKESLSYYWDDFETVLPYQKSWDWLMPVVEKIEKRGCLNELIINGSWCFISLSGFEKIKKRGETKIQAVWEAVVLFIQLYNQNKDL